MKQIITLSLLLLPSLLFAQFTYTLDQSVPVSNGEGSLSMPWAGGLNSIQYNTIDLNHDNVEDLVLFDRMANKVVPFIWQNNKHQYAPEYADFFPADVMNFLMLRDYNCDGKKDIFTGDLLGIKVFTNTTLAGENLSWDQYFFTAGTTKSPVLQTKGFTTKINLQIQFDDLPAIVDADGDGDLDIFNMQFVGNGTIEYHQNFSKERYNSCDSLDFERITRTWGNVKECGCSEFAFDGADCPPSSGGRVKHAGGKTLLALDADGDGEQDLIFSEAECNQLYLLPNEGSIESPVINTFSTFPDVNPVNLILFPAAYYEDVDHDGKKDLLSSPNIYNKESLMIDLQRSSWFYKNTGTASVPLFTFVEKDFLQKQMIDIGDNSKPAFADFDNDGDHDMFISQNSTDKFTSSIFLFKNTGTATSPQFVLDTDDYLNFSLGNFYNLKIQFVDINKDNTVDLVFTATSFDTGSTGLYMLANKSTAAFDFSGQTATRLNFNLTFGENIYVTNVDGDSQPDILAGRGTGRLEFWKNNGPDTDPIFTREQEDFLGLSSLNIQNFTCAASDLDADGNTDLMISDETGRLKIISNYRSDADHTLISEIIFNPSSTAYGETNLGGRLWPEAVNLFKSSRPSIVVGNLLGGIHLLRNDEGQSLPPSPVVHMYPNPVNRGDYLSIRTDRDVHMQIISLLGQRVSDPFVIEANEIDQYQVPALAAGVYLVKFTANKRTTVKRLVIR
jgi:hypothetical protein